MFYRLMATLLVVCSGLQQAAEGGPQVQSDYDNAVLDSFGAGILAGFCGPLQYNPGTRRVYCLTNTPISRSFAGLVADLGGPSGHLLSINDSSEYNWILSTFPSNETYWLGLERSGGSWQWDSGDPLGSYSDWCGGVPPPPGAGQQATMNACVGAGWEAIDDGSGTHSFRAIIEMPVSLFCVRVNCNGGLFGHSWVELVPGSGPGAGDTYSWGLYSSIPDPTPAQGGALFGGTARLNPDSHRSEIQASLCYAVTEAQLGAAAEKLADELQSPGTYNLLGRNCTGFVAELALWAFVDLPEYKRFGIPMPSKLCESILGMPHTAGGVAQPTQLGPQAVAPLSLLDTALEDPAAAASPFGLSVVDTSMGNASIGTSGDFFQLELTLTGADPSSELVAIEWGDMDRVYQPHFSSGEQTVRYHGYSMPGTYTAAAVVVDDGAVSRWTWTINVSEGMGSGVHAIEATHSDSLLPSSWSNSGFTVAPLPPIDPFADSIPLPPEHCFGEGGVSAGCTECPCGNNAPIGARGGCLNSAGTGLELIGSGDASVSLSSGDATDLRFSAAGAPPSAFCILNSGDAVAPGNVANPCFGLNSGGQAAVFDGLRCAIINTRRHGGRSADMNGDVGMTNSPWGGEGGPPVGIAVAGGGFVAGQTRYFQVINRDDPLLGCMRGLNTSQAVEITFTP